MGSGVEVVEVDSVVGAGTVVMTIVGSVVELEAELVVVLRLLLLCFEEVDLLKTVVVVVVGAAVTVSVFFEEDEEGGAALDVSFGGAEDAALLVVGS